MPVFFQKQEIKIQIGKRYGEVLVHAGLYFMSMVSLNLEVANVLLHNQLLSQQLYLSIASVLLLQGKKEE